MQSWIYQRSSRGERKGGRTNQTSFASWKKNTHYHLWKSLGLGGGPNLNLILGNAEDWETVTIYHEDELSRIHTARNTKGQKAPSFFNKWRAREKQSKRGGDKGGRRRVWEKLWVTLVICRAYSTWFSQKYSGKGEEKEEGQGGKEGKEEKLVILHIFWIFNDIKLLLISCW